MRGAAAAVAHRREPELTEPSFWGILRGGMPGFLREGFLPLAVFYAGWRLWGTGAGIALAAAASLLVYANERRIGRDGLLVRLSLAFVAVQTTIGLLTHSAAAYLAAPVIANAVWGLAFLCSVVVGRPLAGALACAWYPFPPAFRESREFKRVYGVESVVWGMVLLVRSAIRLALLLAGSVTGFVVVAFVTGAPAMLALMAWSVWYAVRQLSDEAPAPG